MSRPMSSVASPLTRVRNDSVMLCSFVTVNSRSLCDGCWVMKTDTTSQSAVSQITNTRSKLQCHILTTKTGCCWRHATLAEISHGLSKNSATVICIWHSSALVTDKGRRHLRSSDVYTCVVERTQSQIGDRSFSVAGPRLWNNLPTDIRRRGSTFEHYRRLLKAFLFI